MRALTLFLTLALCTISSRGISSEKSAPSETDARIAHAEELFDRGRATESKAICESLLVSLSGHASVELGHTLALMSRIYASEGDYDRAIASAQRSADVYTQIGDASGEAHALNNKGIAELQSGAYPAAEDDLKKALSLSESGTDFENQTQVLNNLGSAYYFRGSYSEATRAYDSAMALVNANPSAKWNEYWLQITKFNQATLLQRLGRYDRALHAYRDVEAASKTLSDSDRAHVYANLGTLYRRLGDPYKALDTYRSAQQVYAKQHDADGEIAVLKNIGIAYALDLDDASRAVAIFRSALALAEKTHNRREEMQAHLYLGETLLRAHDLPSSRQEFERSQSLSNELKTTEEQWKSLYGLGRIEMQSGNADNAERDYRQAIALIERTRGQLQLSTLRAEFFADKREAYDALISILFTKNDRNEAFLFLEKSRARNFQDRMQTNQRSGTITPTLDEVRATLPPNSALLEFWTAGDQIGLVWATRDASGLNLRQLSDQQQAQIQSALASIPASLASNAVSGLAPLDLTFPRRWFLPPGIRHLLIVPDAWISYVPFDLLHTSASNAPLIEGFDISYLPSAVLLRRADSDHRMRWPWTRELVAFGDPAVEASPFGNRAPNQRDSPSLPYSATEIEDISHLARGTSELYLLRADLKKTFLSSAANNAPVLHISTHAFADGNNPENSRLLFSSEAPSGTESEPSYVFLRELYNLDLSRVNLATISACDTERGKNIRGEGVQAFSRALLSAGAASSVTALWRVDDEPTAEFMRQFYYFAMRENRPKAEALRLAKLKFLHSNSKLSDPKIWAAFVLNGDGLSPIPRVLSWTELSLAAICAIAFLATIVLLWSRRSRDRQKRAGRVVTQ